MNVAAGFAWTTLCQFIATGDDITACYRIDTDDHCFYTDGSVLDWNEAKEFCTRRNSTLPIIKDQKSDNVFQQFIANDSYGVIHDIDVINVYCTFHLQVNNSIR